MNEIERVQNQRNKYNSIIEVIGDNNATEQLTNINRDYYLIQKCKTSKEMYMKNLYRHKKHNRVDILVDEFKKGQKIVLRG